jgi:hypothetical protein
VTPERERLIFVCSAVGLWIVFLVVAIHTPPLLDDWYQLTYWRHHDFNLSSLGEYAHYNYFHFNPRIGDVLLAIVNGPPVIHYILTPLVLLAVLPVTFAIAFGRWPRPTLRDLQLLVVMQAFLWVVMPIPGIMYFYRPFATNYLWAFTVTCLMFIPYRFALASTTEQARRLWLVPIMFVAGWLAGMANEHTGPTAMVAMLIVLFVMYRRKQLRAWMLAGGLGLFIGWPMLFLAPGQALRYAGLATRETPLHMLKARGFDGCFEVVLEFIGEAQSGITLFVIVLLVYFASLRRRKVDVPAIPRVALWTCVALLLTAGSIIVTLFASPTASERLFYASAVLFVAVFVVLADHLFEDPRTRRFLVIVSTVIVAYHCIRFVETYVQVKAESDERIAILRSTPKWTVARVPPLDHARRTRWHWGDDFRYASLREYVGAEIFDVSGIELTEQYRWAQPSPPDRYVATRTYDPPLAPEEAAKVAPVPYIPTYWEWAISQLRRLLVTTDIGNYKGHKLVRYTVTSQGLNLDDPKRRPIYVVEWTPDGDFVFLDGRPYDDSKAQPFIRVWSKSLPPTITDSYVVACGRTRRVEPVPDHDEGVGPMLPIDLECRGTYTGVMCEPDRCWIAGRYWR